MNQVPFIERLTMSRFYFDLLVWVLLIFIFYVLFSNIFRRAKEKNMYRIMISNPTDNTVNNYIKSFKKINGFTAMIFNLFFSSQNAHDKMRQSQGYDIIKDCSSVSDLVKEQLKNIFISYGVPIKL